MKVDVRVLAATNRDLRARRRDGAVSRRSLLPPQRHRHRRAPLRERREEIPLLAAYFVERYSKLYQRDQASSSSARCSIV